MKYNADDLDVPKAEKPQRILLNEYRARCVQVGACDMLSFVQKKKKKRGVHACLCSDSPWNGTENPGRCCAHGEKDGCLGEQGARLGSHSLPFYAFGMLYYVPVNLPIIRSSPSLAPTWAPPPRPHSPLRKPEPPLGPEGWRCHPHARPPPSESRSLLG